MFLKLAHTQLDSYRYSRELILEVYRITRHFPETEKFGLVSQIRRAALSIHLNLAEGCSRKSKADRKRFFEIARGSLIEVDTAIGLSFDLLFTTEDQIVNLEPLIINTFKVLTGMIVNE
jgi:four helix bundle protein